MVDKFRNNHLRRIALFVYKAGIRNENDRSIGLLRKGAPLLRVRSSRVSAAQTPSPSLLLNTKTSSVVPVSVTRTLIFCSDVVSPGNCVENYKAFYNTQPWRKLLRFAPMKPRDDINQQVYSPTTIPAKNRFPHVPLF